MAERGGGMSARFAGALLAVLALGRMQLRHMHCGVGFVLQPHMLQLRPAREFGARHTACQIGADLRQAEVLLDHPRRTTLPQAQHMAQMAGARARLHHDDDDGRIEADARA